MLVDPFFRKLVGSIRRRVRSVLPLFGAGSRRRAAGSSNSRFSCIHGRKGPVPPSLAGWVMVRAASGSEEQTQVVGVRFAAERLTKAGT
jgi:hypothetical protein